MTARTEFRLILVVLQVFQKKACFFFQDLLVQDLSDVWYIGLNVYALTPVDIINHQNSEKIARITDFAERNGVRLRIPGHSIPTTLPVRC